MKSIQSAGWLAGRLADGLTLQIGPIGVPIGTCWISYRAARIADLAAGTWNRAAGIPDEADEIPDRADGIPDRARLDLVSGH